jgi:plasmid stabilization system protein ParE
MGAPFEFTRQATDDLDAIWRFIADDNRDAADRVELEIVAACRRLAKHPLLGTMRRDITSLPVRFWTVAKFPNYVIVYRPETAPLQVIAVLHGKRDLKLIFYTLRSKVAATC